MHTGLQVERVRRMVVLARRSVFAPPISEKVDAIRLDRPLGKQLHEVSVQMVIGHRSVHVPVIVYKGVEFLLCDNVDAAQVHVYRCSYPPCG